MRSKIVAGNWKMNKTASEAITLVNEICILLKSKPITDTDIKVIIAPPFVALSKVNDIIKTFPNVFLAAQNCHSKSKGAYTGEISAEMLKDIGCQYVIIGHSERRSYFAEKDDFLAEKVNILLANNLNPIFCCGEQLSERQKGIQNEVVYSQINNALFHLSNDDFSKIVIAYEPVWAIGTGVTATPEQAQDMHAYIRGLISDKYDVSIANNSSILYGGSCNAKNAHELFEKPDLDGGLIGGASLIAEDFVTIIHSF